MVNPDDLNSMSEQEKIELLGMLAESEEGYGVGADFYGRLLHDPSPEVRKLAVQALWDFPEEEYIEPLIEVAEYDPEVEVRARALSVLGIFIYEGAAMNELPEAAFLRVRRYLLEIARDASQPLLPRRMALEALSFDAADDVAELTEWAYHHENEEVNLTAIFSMGRSQSSRWSEYIVKELYSDNRRRLLEAITAVSEGFVEEATPRLRHLALSRDKEVRLSAIWALAHSGGPGALEVLEMCAESKDEEVREAAEEAIMEYASLRDGEGEDAKRGDADGE
jgi:HEAT repeat protein